jgi:hypothetical protein
MRKLTAGIGLATMAVPAVVAAQASPWGTFRAYRPDDADMVRAMWQGKATDAATPDAKLLAAVVQGCMFDRGDAIWQRLQSRLETQGHVLESKGNILAFAVYSADPQRDISLKDGYKLGFIHSVAFNVGLCASDLPSIVKSTFMLITSEMQAAGYDGIVIDLPFSLSNIGGFGRSADQLGLHFDQLGTSTQALGNTWRAWLLFRDSIPALALEIGGK